MWRSNKSRWGLTTMINVAGEPDFPATRHIGQASAELGGMPRRTIRSGETDERLYARLAPELIRFATSLVGPSDAEDLLGATVAKAISSPRWPGVDNKRAYLYRMIVNEAHKSRRSTSRRVDRELRVVRADVISTEHRLDPDVLVALKRLTVRQRAVIYLTYWADLSPGQVAETLRISLRTVERELTNGRTRLEQVLS